MRRLTALNKVDVSPVVLEHYRTLRNARTGRVAPTDLAVLVGLPVVAGALVLAAGVRVHSVIVVASAVSVFAALLFGLLAALLNMVIQAAGQAREGGPSEGTRRQARVVAEFGANVGYAVLVAIVAAAVLVVVALGVAPDEDGVQRAPPAVSAVITAVLAHLGLTLLMVLKRVFMILRGEAVTARTGSEADDPQ